MPLLHLCNAEERVDPSGKTTLDVYNIEDPFEADLFAVIGQSRARMRDIIVWQVDGSDTEGCQMLTDPVVAAPTLPLASPKIPCLSLVWELEALGYHEVHNKVIVFAKGLELPPRASQIPLPGHNGSTNRGGGYF